MFHSSVKYNLFINAEIARFKFDLFAGTATFEMKCLKIFKGLKVIFLFIYFNKLN